MNIFKQNRLKSFLFIFLLTMSFCVLAGENKSTTKISVDTGISLNSISDNDAIVGEYFNFDNSPRMVFGLEGVFQSNNLFLYSAFTYNEINDNSFVLDMDWNDSLNLKFDTQTFKHRTVHDPLNFNFSTENPNLSISDLSPSSKPYLDYSETNLSAVYTLQSYKNFKLHGEIRTMERSGYGQSISLLSQSFPQAIYGQEIPVNTTTDDYAGGITLKVGKVVFDNTYSYRRFDSQSNSDLSIGTTDLFYENTPEFDKWQNKFSIYADLGHKTSVYADYVTYAVNNYYLQDNLGIDGVTYDSMNVKLSSSVVKNLHFNVFFKTESLDNDVNKWYDTNLPSAMNRDIDKWGADFLFRITGNSKIRVKYINKAIDRESSSYQLAHPIKTEQDTYKVVFSTKLFKMTRVRFEWQKDEITNPFSNIKMANEANDFGEQYPVLTSMYTDNDKYRVFIDTNLGDNFSLNFDLESGRGEYNSENSNYDNWNEDYDVYTCTVNYTSNSSFGMFFFVSILRGDSTTYLAPSLSDFQFVNESGIWNTGIVPFSSDVDTYGIGFNIKPSKKLFINGNVTYTLQNSDSDTNSLTDMGLNNWGMYSATDSSSLNFNVQCNYKLYDNLSFRLQLLYSDFSNNLVYVSNLNGTGYAGIIGFNWKK